MEKDRDMEISRMLKVAPGAVGVNNHSMNETCGIKLTNSNLWIALHQLLTHFPCAFLTFSLH